MATPVYMHTLGCPKNRVDSEVMLGTLAQAGYRLVQDPARADVIVVNTCGFIESAKEESVQAILSLSRMKEEGRCKKLVVAGCLTQRYPEEMAREMPEVDHFVGTGAYADIAAIVSDAQARRIVVPDPDFVHSASTPRVNSLARHTAYLKIAEGCDNACAFCIIPALRGPQRSRTVEDVVAEAESLAAQGVVELSLVAQDLTAYGQDLPGPGKVRLHHLLPELCRVEGIRWIRLHYAYPRDFPDALVDVIAREPRIAKYVDMPLQHSSDRLLRSMKRGRDARFLRGLLAKLRERVPGIALRTALIVGLPGETEDDFEDLLRFVEEQRFERLGVFTYSREEGTAAAEMDGQLPERVKKARQRKVMALQRRISRAQQRAMVGRRLEVLVEGKAEGTDHLLVGRHAQQAPEIDGLTYVNDFAVPGEKVAYPGEIVTVEVTEAGDYDLVGRVVARDPRRPGRRLPAAPAPADPRSRPVQGSPLRVLR
ncbi:MAG TPA: 30S ribosomal protein S12 methylthiotransferase RimO [Anaeromyxobacteraceae bacterium]|nr:30S ribosomal protein S12 methylthiotransferase RimO [Anaeromyxobacteraceae bacterium]